MTHEVRKKLSQNLNCYLLAPKPLIFLPWWIRIMRELWLNIRNALFIWSTQRFQLQHQQGIARSSRLSDFSHIPGTGTAWSIGSGFLSAWVILPLYTCLILLPPHFQISCSFHDSGKAQKHHKRYVRMLLFLKEKWRDIHWAPTACQILSLCIYYFTASSTMLQCRH